MLPFYQGSLELPVSHEKCPHLYHDIKYSKSVEVCFFALSMRGILKGTLEGVEHKVVACSCID